MFLGRLQSTKYINVFWLNFVEHLWHPLAVLRVFLLVSLLLLQSGLLVSCLIPLALLEGLCKRLFCMRSRLLLAANLRRRLTSDRSWSLLACLDGILVLSAVFLLVCCCFACGFLCFASRCFFVFFVFCVSF